MTYAICDLCGDEVDVSVDDGWIGGDGAYLCGDCDRTLHGDTDDT